MAVVLTNEQLEKALIHVRLVRVEMEAVTEEPLPDGVIDVWPMPEFEPVRMKVSYDVLTGRIISCVPVEGGE